MQKKIKKNKKKKKALILILSFLIITTLIFLFYFIRTGEIENVIKDKMDEKGRMVDANKNKKKKDKAETEKKVEKKNYIEKKGPKKEKEKTKEKAKDRLIADINEEIYDGKVKEIFKSTKKQENKKIEELFEEKKEEKIVSFEYKKAEQGVWNKQLEIVVEINNKKNVEGAEYKWVEEGKSTTIGKWGNLIIDKENILEKKEVEGEYSLYIKVIDKEGNMNVEKVGPFKIDDKKPEIDIICKENKCIKDKEFNIQIVDKGSGIEKEEYAWSQKEEINEWKEIENGKVFGEETGGKYLYIKAEDKVGNSEIEKFGPYNFTEESKELKVIIENNNGILKETVVKLEIIGEIEIDKCFYRWISEKDEITSGYLNCDDGFKTIEEMAGKYYLEVKVIEKSGNETVNFSEMIDIDNVSPKISIKNINYEKSHKEIFPSLLVEDDNEVENIYFYWGNINGKIDSQSLEWKLYQEDQDLKKNIEIGELYLQIKAVDEAGNEEIIISDKIKFDNIAPTINIEQNNSDYYKETETIVKIEDHNEVKKYYNWTKNSSELNFDDDEWKEYEGEYPEAKKGETGEFYLHIKAIDEAGNENIKTSNVFKLDNEKPYIIINKNGSEKYIKSIETGLNVIDLTETKTYYYWSENNTILESEKDKWLKYNSGDKIIKNDGNGEFYLHIKSKDALGNEIDKTSDVYKLDNEKPEIIFEKDGNNDFEVSAKTNVVIKDQKIEKTYYYWNSESTLLNSESDKWIEYNNNEGIPEYDEKEKAYLQIKAIDEAGNENIKSSKVFNIDNLSPNIEFLNNGNTEYETAIGTEIKISEINLKNKKYAWTETPLKLGKNDEEWNEFVGDIPPMKINATGIYYLQIMVEDLAGNTTIEVSKEFKIDNSAPVVEMHENGNNLAKNEEKVNINIKDHSEINEIKYAWSTSPDKAVNYKTIEIEDSVREYAFELEVPNDDLENQYLFIKTKDILGFEKEEISKKFLMNSSLNEEEKNKIALTKCENRNITENPTEFFEYEKISDGIKITGYTGGNDVVIPCVIEGEEVVEIGEYTFQYYGLNSVILPNTLKRIKKYAFNSNNLISIEVPSSVLEIGEEAFRYNNLTNMLLQKGIEKIDNYAFYGYKNITLVLPGGLKYLGKYNFYNSGLEVVKLPDTLEFIGESAFQNNKIVNVNIPKEANYIGDYAFRYNQIKEVKIYEKVNYLGYSAFMENKISDLEIEEGANNFSRYAFSKNEIKKVIIPSSLKEIPEDGFSRNLIEEVIINNGVEKISGNAFSENKINKNLIIPESVKIIDHDAFYDNLIPSVEFKEGLVSIGSSSFNRNQISGKVTIPKTVEIIGGSAFGQNKIKEVEINEGLKEISGFVFSYNEIEKVTIPKTVENIINGAFNNNPNIRFYIDENNPNYISDENHLGIYSKNGEKIIFGTESVYGTEMYNNVKIIGEKAFYQASLNSVIIPNKVETIENAAFSSNYNVQEVEIPASVKTIGSEAFYYNAITNLTLNEGLVEIKDYAFFNNSIDSVILPSTLEILGANAFERNKINTLILNDKIKKIPNKAFSSNLIQSLNIPVNVLEIGDSAFASNKINNLSFSESISIIGKYTFENNALVSLDIPGSITSIGTNAFYGNSLLKNVNNYSSLTITKFFNSSPAIVNK